MAYQIVPDYCTGCTACFKLCPTQAIIGERNSVHHINPDLCISCGVCGKVCHYTAILNDEEILSTSQPKKEWLIPFWNQKECVSCNICLFACPTNAITINLYSETNNFRYILDQKKCIGCGFCAQDCPVEVIKLISRSQILAFSKRPDTEA